MPIPTEDTDNSVSRFCKIEPFSLQSLFSNISNENCLRTQNDHSILYLYNYLNHLNCTKIVIEQEYVDRDFLDDFASYYVKCFKEYRRFCRRIHFFTQLDDNELTSYLEGSGDPVEISGKLNKAYLGYLVAKPLPKAIIGRTVLIPWEDTVTSGDDVSQKRSIRCVREYGANLAGIELPVEGLAFQEQDKVMAACATSALWAAFQLTGNLFGHSQPTQSEITGYATRFYQQTRPVPSTGLTTSQMSQAVRGVGLEPEFKEVYSRTTEEGSGGWRYNIPLLSTCYSYLRGGIPIILASLVKGIGEHAVTLVGYRLGETGPSVSDIRLFDSEADIELRGSRVIKFYAHDDQIGPYSRLTVQPGVEVANVAPLPIELGSDWRTRLGTPTTFVPMSLIIPVYHKIRVPFISAYHLATRMNFALIKAMSDTPVEWDIFISSVNSYKKEISGRSDIAANIRENILCLSHPRFLWRARAFADDIEVCELIVDATDMEMSFQLFNLNIFDEYLLELLREMPEDVQEVLEEDATGIGRFLLEAIRNRMDQEDLTTEE